MAKYNSYIELSPHYESVVDIDSESRHPDMWQEYIVHEDMKGAIEKNLRLFEIRRCRQETLFLDTWRIWNRKKLCSHSLKASV